MTRDDIEALCAEADHVYAAAKYPATDYLWVARGMLPRLATALCALAQENETLRQERDYLRCLTTLQAALDAAQGRGEHDMTPAALVRVPQQPDAPKPRATKRAKLRTVAVVHVINPMTAARLSQAQEFGYALRCAYRNGMLQVWTEEAKP